MSECRMEFRQAAHALRAELELWRAEGCTPRFWWRDDDAHTGSGELADLLSIGDAPPLLLAVIPGCVDQAFCGLMDRYPRIDMCQHGWMHRNHAAAGEPACEFGPTRPFEVVAQELRAGFDRLRQLFGQRFRPIFVPPWHTMSKQAAATLPGIGIRVLSRRAYAHSFESSGVLPTINVQVDLADWKQGGSFVGRTRALDALTRQLILRRRVTQRVDEPIGLLTHHNVLGREGRQFLGQLFDLLSEPMVNWLDADQIIAIAVRGPARCAS